MSKFVWSLCAVALALSAAAALAGKATSPPKRIVLDACKAKRAPVPFDHQKHAEGLKIACGHCHHTQKALKVGSDEDVKKCTECHLEPKEAGTPDCASPSMTANPYHRSCVGCHKQEIGKHPAIKAPTKCDVCHKAG